MRTPPHLTFAVVNSYSRHAPLQAVSPGPYVALPRRRQAKRGIFYFAFFARAFPFVALPMLSAVASNPAVSW